jgi:cobalt-zinc-cadmium efflux system protein
VSLGTHEDRAGARHLRPLGIAFGLIVVFLVVEVVTGLITGSLALVSDAGHMATDALGIGMALAAIVAADRTAAGGSRTYGLYRLEILAALANAGLLFAVSGYVLYESMQRLFDPIEVAAIPMLIVATLGLLVNVVSWRLLRPGFGESLNVEGAYLEVVADLAGSIGVIAAALIVITTGWPYADPLIAATIAVFIIPRAWRLGRAALRVLVQAAPEGLDMEQLNRALGTVPGVVDVHDLHVWTLTSEMDVATVHLMIAEAVDPHPVLDEARSILRDRYAIDHATLQVEPETDAGCAEISW